MAYDSKEKRNAYERKRRANNLEKLRAYQRQYQNKRRAENREKQREYDRQWYAKNSERALGYYFKKKYGLTREKYFELLDACGHRCSVCGTSFSSKNGPHIDHCHNTDVVRGVLCGDCNKAEGFLKTPANALKMYEYMNRNILFYPVLSVDA